MLTLAGILNVKGRAVEDLLKLPRVAVVGSRNMSDQGREKVREVVPDLAKSGVVILSGLARGIDTYAHLSCLESGGITAAVLPCSTEEIYPRENRELAQRIIESGGSLITEYEVGTALNRANFLARNRLIAALSSAVLVIEAGERSGSISTARAGLKLNKSVFILKDMDSPALRQLKSFGAVEVTSAADILGYLKTSPLDLQ